MGLDPGLRSNVGVDPGPVLSLVRFRRSLFYRTRSQWFSVLPPCLSRSVALAVSHAGCVVFLAFVLCPSRRLCHLRAPWRLLSGPASYQTLVRPQLFWTIAFSEHIFASSLSVAAHTIHNLFYNM